MLICLRVLLIAGALLAYSSSYAQSPTSLTAARPITCPSTALTCAEWDAIVFVHGIYGSRETFINPNTNFNWPAELPPRFRDRPVDVFQLSYRTELVAWASGINPGMKDLNSAVFAALKPLRIRQYRSIGFIAHSLGGNVVSTYVHYVKSSRNHPTSSQHAFVITLATPVLGSQVEDIGSVLKSALGMSDPLLKSLTKDNLFLEMLLEFRLVEGPKRELYGCRPVSLHAAFEERYLGPLLVVTRESAGDAVAQLASSPIVGFRLNHSDIVKPTDNEHEVYKWVNARIEDEFVRLGTWEKAVSGQPRDFKLCTDIPFRPEVLYLPKEGS